MYALRLMLTTYRTEYWIVVTWIYKHIYTHHWLGTREYLAIRICMLMHAHGHNHKRSKLNEQFFFCSSVSSKNKILPRIFIIIALATRNYDTNTHTLRECETREKNGRITRFDRIAVINGDATEKPFVEYFYCSSWPQMVSFVLSQISKI